MKFKIKDFSKEFLINEDVQHVVLIEDTIKYRELLSQIKKDDLSDEIIFFYENNKIHTNSSIFEYVDNTLDIDLNTSFMRKTYRYLESISNEYYKEDIYKFKVALSDFLFTITDDLDLHFDITENFKISKIFESVKLSMFCETDSIVDTLCKYMDFINKIENKNIFIFNSLRFMLSRDELNILYDYANHLKYNIITIERVLLYDIFDNEELYICDSDLCEIY